VHYKDAKINVVDTPGHADFGGEVERILKMVNGVILLVDAAEGPMPQTRFVLSRALELGHRVIVVVNKIDRPDQRVHEVVDEVLELLLDLDATDEQLDSPMLFCSGRQGTASFSPDVAGTDLTPLFDTILDYIPAPEADTEAPFQMLVSSIDYNEFVGRIAVGRIERGSIKQNDEIAVCNFHTPDEPPKKAKATALYTFDGLAKVPASEASAGEIIALSGIGDITIGDTICVPSVIEPIEFVKISAPTMEMTFSVNDSPFAGKEGKFVTSRQLRERLFRETMKDVSLRVTEVENSTDSFNVAGRGEMSLSILMETMRREGYEFQVSPPRVLFQEIDGKKCEPIERLVVDVPADCVGSVIEAIGRRKGDMLDMTPVGDRMKVQFLVPSRGLFGYRNEFLTATKGEGIMASVFEEYAPMKGEIARRNTGSLVAFETGEAVTYGLYNAQERGALFIGAGTPVYAGMIVGECPKQEDISVNVCKKKQLTNMRASGSDEALRLVPPRQMSLEQDLEFLADDELLECTPENLRLRKRILDHGMRMREASKKK
ncbi:MAG: translational GTPase TypA, partial [Oscillospiraceae bacterium]|nr:translational GTPase TypA [Oscillospiraceae bacterium]